MSAPLGRQRRNYFLAIELHVPEWYPTGKYVHNGKEVFRIWWANYLSRLSTCRRCSILYADGSAGRHYEPVTEDACEHLPPLQHSVRRMK